MPGPPPGSDSDLSSAPLGLSPSLLILTRAPRGNHGEASPQTVQQGKRVIHEGTRRKTKGHEGVGGESRGIRQRLGRGKRFPGRGKKISTKGHEERRRATKGLEEAQEGSAKGRARGKDFQEGAKRYPRRATKNGEGPRRGWRRVKRIRQRLGRGLKELSAKGLQRGWKRLEGGP